MTRTVSGRDLSPAPAHPASVATLGVFDGVHRGHRRILEETVRAARGAGVPAVAVTFSPHPLAVVGDGAPKAILPLASRVARIESVGFDDVWIVPFDADLAAEPAAAFAERVFGECLRARRVVMGEAARFGRGREGSAEWLAAWGAPRGLQVTALPTLDFDGHRVSSSAVRAAVADGDIPLARTLLGYAPEVSGTVVTGRRRGRVMGFPTLNLEPPEELLVPPAGVYLSRARFAGEDEPWHPSVTSVGLRNDLREEVGVAADEGRLVVETHLLNANGDDYGRTLTVSFLARMRENRRFERWEELMRAVRTDLSQAREAHGLPSY